MTSKSKSSYEDRSINPEASKRPKSNSGDDPNPIQAPNQQSLAEERAFLNVLIVRKILSFLRPDQLFKLRAVSKTFEDEATFLLLSNERAQELYSIKFTRQGLSNHERKVRLRLKPVPELVQECYRHSKMGTLTDFVQDCWKNSRRFPVSHFTFLNSNFEDILLDFFIIVGEYITGLSFKPPRHYDCPLDPCNFFGSTQMLASILFERTPNLRHLTLNSTPWSPTHYLLDRHNTEKNQGERQVIPSLETLTVEGEGLKCSFGVVQDIIQSAPNLQRVLDPTLKFTEVLGACGKLHLGSHVSPFKLDDPTIVRYCSFTEGPRGHLREVSIDFGPFIYNRCHPSVVRDESVYGNNVGKALIKIFQVGRQSLEKIGRLPFLNNLKGLLPAMEKVTTVHFQDDQRTKKYMRIVPYNQTLRQVFPSLTTLRLDNMKTRRTANPLFKLLDYHRHDGVTSLAMENNILPSWIQRSSELFPNLTTFQLWNTSLKNTPKIFCKIWTHLEGLEHLEISVEKTEETKAFRMDSAITGFPVEACEQLHTNLTEEGNGQAKENVEHLRANPSILNLHNLKTFKIGYSLYCPEELFTSVTTVYALQPMIERQGLYISIV